ncbi:hypothetical protein [Neorhizobium vignae]|uniref:hypothetical protein n=1 Tax=Neorhizobium vignae TaxID=690585 RepID=UPI000567D55B|nr:hypothetical protein [Neorhizobium vignae]
MKWSETHHLAATNNSKAKATMSAVDAFSPEEAQLFAEKMFRRRCEGWGDETQALDEVSGWCGMSPRSFKRLMKGEFKDFGLRSYRRVRGAFLDFNLRLIHQLQNEVKAVEEAHGHAPVADIAAKLEALEAEARAAKARVKTYPKPANQR